MAKKNSETREERIARICGQINKGDFGGDDNNAVMWLGSRESVSMVRFSSGNPELDNALGGGWPKGRFIEVYGPESGGKSTLCLHAIAEFQKKFPDEDVALVDTEYSFDEEYAQNVGVDTRFLVVHQPDSGLQALNVMKQLVGHGISLIIVDSVAALTTKSEIQGNIGDDQVAEQARMMSQALRTLTTEAGKRQTTIIWTNQMREKIGVTYGDRTTTPAGRALKHYASVRVAIRRVATQKETVDGEELAIANKTKVDVKKNKTSPPFRQAEFFIVYGRGIDPIISLFDLALKHKIIEKRGSWFSYDDQQLGQGRHNVIEMLREDKEMLGTIEKAIQNKEVKKEPVNEAAKEDSVQYKKPKTDDNAEVEVTDV